MLSLWIFFSFHYKYFIFYYLVKKHLSGVFRNFISVQRIKKFIHFQKKIYPLMIHRDFTIYIQLVDCFIFCQMWQKINVTKGILFRGRIFFYRISITFSLEFPSFYVSRINVATMYSISAMSRKKRVLHARQKSTWTLTNATRHAPLGRGTSRRRRTSARRINPIPSSHEKPASDSALLFARARAPKCARGGLSAQKHVILALPSISSLFRLPLGIISGCTRLLPG